MQHNTIFIRQNRLYAWFRTLFTNKYGLSYCFLGLSVLHCYDLDNKVYFRVRFKNALQSF